MNNFQNVIIESPKIQLTWPIKALILLWMTTVIFFYLLLKGPPEFWSIAEKLGVWFWLKHLQSYLYPIFHHDLMLIYQ